MEFNKIKLYVDMDGVLTNFNGLFESMFKTHPAKFEKEKGETEFFNLVEKEGEKYWSEMPWKEDGKELWEYVSQFDPIILSAPANFSKSTSGKEKWIDRELGDVPYIIENKKEIYSNRYSILIDDFPSKINPWKRKGGMGILHTSTKETILEMEKIMELV